MKMIIGLLFILAFAIVIGLNFSNKNVPVREESFTALEATHVGAHSKTTPLFGPGGRGKPPTKRFRAHAPTKVEEHYLVALEIDGKIREVPIPAAHLEAIQSGTLDLRFKVYKNGKVELLEVLN